MKKIILFLIIFIYVAQYAYGGRHMVIKSNSYKDGQDIPKKYVMKTIGGENISPEFSWENVPEKTKSFALIMVDPHPISRNWVHWAVINIPSSFKKLEEGFSGSKTCAICVELTNSFGFKGYGGPQPPRGTGKHPYVTYVFALSVDSIKIKEKPSYDDFLSAIKPYVLDKGEYRGYFEQK